MFGSRSQAGFSMFEAILAVGAIGILFAALGKQVKASRQIQRAEAAVIDRETIRHYFWSLVKDPVTCEHTNIVEETTMARTKINTSSDEIIREMDELAIIGEKGKHVILKKGEYPNHEVVYIQIKQRLSLIGATAPHRVPLYIDIGVKPLTADGETKYRRGVKNWRYYFMGETDATGKLTSCYAVFSRRLACEDMGWIFDPKDGEGSDCHPPEETP